MTTLLLILLMGVHAVPPQADHCTLTIDGEAYALEHHYALRIPHPFDEAARFTRLICTGTPLTEDQFAAWDTLLEAFHADGQRGVFVDLQDDGSVIAVRLSWGDLSTLWSGAVWEVAFDGETGPDRLAGTITTDPLMKVFRQAVRWGIAATIDHAPVAVW